MVRGGPKKMKNSSLLIVMGKILRSRSYQTLESKNQVIPRHYSTAFLSSRMSHSAEVASLALDIANDLRDYYDINHELVFLGGLIHDIGQPPFAHQGEEFLQKHLKGFDHAGFGIFRLEVVDGIKLPEELCTVIRDHKTNGFILSTVFDKISFESFLIVAADKIAYVISDAMDLKTIRPKTIFPEFKILDLSKSKECLWGMLKKEIVFGIRNSCLSGSVLLADFEKLRVFMVYEMYQKMEREILSLILGRDFYYLINQGFKAEEAALALALIPEPELMSLDKIVISHTYGVKELNNPAKFYLAEIRPHLAAWLKIYKKH
jgi:dGTPase